MLIESIELFQVAQADKHVVAEGSSAPSTESVLVCMHSGGESGWGEASPGRMPLDRDQWAGGVFAALDRWFAPAMVHAQIDTAEDLYERLSPLCGNSYARGALEMAWSDLESRRREEPLHRFLGGQDRGLMLGRCFAPMASIDDLMAAIQQAIDAGYRQTTLEFRAGWDAEVVRAVRQMFPHESLRIDCNGGCQIDQTNMFHLLDDFMLDAIEQPFAPHDLVAHAMLQESLRTPLCLDQSVESLADAQAALDLQSARAINLTPDRVGGHSAALAIRDACAQAGVEVLCCVADENTTQIGARHALALAVQDGFSETAQLPMKNDEEIVDRKTDGTLVIRPSQRPGIGIEPDRKAIEQLSVAIGRID